MREIKFRAWDKKYERMVVPYYFEKYHFSDQKRFNRAEWVYYEGYRELEDGRYRECELMQFTGIEDSASVEIFDRDILKNKEGLVGLVVWISEWAMFGVLFDYELEQYTERGADGLDYSMFWTFPIESAQVEVIGNIYENPELLTRPLSENINS